MLRSPALLIALVLLTGALASPTAAAETVFFAFDDQNLGWQHNLKLTLVSPDKHPGNPVLRCGPAGSPDHGHAILYGTVLRDGQKFRMWYLGMIQRELSGTQAPGWFRPMCYAESADGITWTKPQLGLVDLGGNKQNNICLIEGKVQSHTLINDFLSVLYEPHDPDPARRYKAAYIAHIPYDDIPGGMSNVGIKERRVGAIVTATSADGLRWQIVGDRPANAGGERFEVSSLYRFGNFYYCSGQLASPWCWLADGRPCGRVMQTYRSPDFLHWSQGKALSMTLPQQYTDPQPSAAEMLQGFSNQMHMGTAVWNRGNVLVGVHGLWNAIPRDRPKDAQRLDGLRIDLGLSLSNDGVRFREPIPNFKFLQHGSSDQWDSFALLQGHAFVNVGEQTYIWYSHWDCEGKFRHQEIGLATLRRDGFGYLSRQDEGDPGHCTTSVVAAAPHARQIVVNAAGLTPDAPLKVELLDDLDRPIPGYSGADAALLSQDGTGQPLTWPKSGATATPKDRPFAIRLTLPDNNNAKLYAVYVRD